MPKLCLSLSLCVVWSEHVHQLVISSQWKFCSYFNQYQRAKLVSYWSPCIVGFFLENLFSLQDFYFCRSVCVTYFSQGWLWSASYCFLFQSIHVDTFYLLALLPISFLNKRHDIGFISIIVANNATDPGCSFQSKHKHCDKP